MSVKTLASIPGGGGAILSGLLANIPPFGVADTYYYATDVFVLFRDTGAAWEKVGGMRYARYLDTLFYYRQGAGPFVANTVYLAPIQVRETVTIDSLVVTVTVAAGNIRLGLYNDGGALVPDGGTLIVETASIAVGATGKFECAIANTRLTPGLYWFAMQTDNVGLNLVCQIAAAIGDNQGALPNSRSYALVYGAFTNPCPVTVANALSCLGKIRVLSIP